MFCSNLTTNGCLILILFNDNYQLREFYTYTYVCLILTILLINKCSDFKKSKTKILASMIIFAFELSMVKSNLESFVDRTRIAELRRFWLLHLGCLMISCVFYALEIPEACLPTGTVDIIVCFCLIQE